MPKHTSAFQRVKNDLDNVTVDYIEKPEEIA